MIDYCLQKIVKKLIKRQFIKPDTDFELRFDDDPRNIISLNSLSLTSTSYILSPVTAVTIYYPKFNVERNLVKILLDEIIWRFSCFDVLQASNIYEQILKGADVVYDKKSNIINKDSYLDDYKIRVYTHVLPKKYLDSFLYKNDLINHRKFETLLQVGNTCINKTDYNAALKYINTYTKEVRKMFDIPYSKGVDSKAMLEHILTDLCNFKVRIRESKGDTIKNVLIIEKV